MGRLFTAVDISEDVRERLGRFLAKVQPLANLRWTSAANLHVTTKFIGEWPKQRSAELERVLTAMPKAGPLMIRIRGLGWFPNPHSPRVFWAGVEAFEGLKSLAAETSRAVETLGIPAEAREYSPHLTLGRTRENTPKESLQAVRQVVAALESDDFGEFEATAQFLYLSSGGTYTKLAQYNL